MKKFRTQHNKYNVGNYETALLLHKFCKKEISHLLIWMEEKLGEHEVIEISNWYEDNIHITVIDTRDNLWSKHWGHVEKMRLGFSANVQDDTILWKGIIHKTGAHGNVFVRSNKWKSEIKKKFGAEIYYSKVSVYETINPVKELNNE